MTSPLGAASSTMIARVSGAMTTAASARATRSVSSLAPTSTMAARPRSSRWLSSLRALAAAVTRQPPIWDMARSLASASLQRS